MCVCICMCMHAFMFIHNYIRRHTIKEIETMNLRKSKSTGLEEEKERQNVIIHEFQKMYFKKF